MTTKKNIVLLFGGCSAEHEVSIRSASAVYDNLNKKKFNIHCLYINKEGKWKPVKTPKISFESLNKGPFHPFLPWKTKNDLDLPSSAVYFPVLHGPFGEDGTIQGLLELADVPYVGATVLSSAVGMDKSLSKSIFKAKGLPVVKHSVIYEKDWIQQEKKVLEKINKEYSYPLFVKPCNLGSSIGISKVLCPSQLPESLNLAFRYDFKILVEKAVKGRELECSVLGNEKPKASLPGEVIPFRDFYDYKDKYIEGKTKFEIPAEIPESVIEEIQKISVTAFQSIEGSGMARVDFFFKEEKHKLFLNEINTIPGFTEISMYPKLWEVSGINFPTLLEKLISLGETRHAEKQQKKDHENFRY